MISHHSRMKRYCSEQLERIENYDKAIADTERQWDCHHRGEILPCGVFSIDDLKRCGLYWNRPASELIFIPHHEHTRLHTTGKNHPYFGKHHSEEARRKISEAMKGNNHPNFGKHHSEESKRKMSEARKRYWEKRRAGK